MQVLEAAEVAAGDDQVHALGVLDVEVAHRAARAVDDPEADLLGGAAPQLGVLDDQSHAVGGDRQAAHGHGGGHAAVLLGGRVAARSRRAAHGAGERAGAEQGGQDRGEAGELRERAHTTTAAVT